MQELKDIESWIPKSRVYEHPIMCPHCKQESGYTEEMMRFYCIMHDLNCKKCGKVAITKGPSYTLEAKLDTPTFEVPTLGAKEGEWFSTFEKYKIN